MRSRDEVDRELLLLELAAAPGEGGDVWRDAVRYALRWVLEYDPKAPTMRLRHALVKLDGLSGAVRLNRHEHHY